MEKPKFGDRVSHNGREYVIVAIDEETDSVSLLPAEDVMEDVPFEKVRPLGEPMLY